MSERLTRRLVTSLMLAVLVAAAAPGVAAELEVAATLPDLASLAREVGGEAVDVTTFARGGDDPHFVEARPSFIRVLHRADVLVYNGLDLEIGWLPPLLRKARNSRIRSGAEGHVDASYRQPVLQVLTGRVDRSMGDVHPQGNPHYLLDPVNGLRAARRLRDVFSTLRPDLAGAFGARYASFQDRLVRALVGDPLAEAIGVDGIAEAALSKGPDAPLDVFLAERGGGIAVGGWIAALAADRARPIVADHDLWPYFEKRFGVEVVDFLEPVPGITPTTRHLSELSQRMKSEGIRVILSAAYFHPRYAGKLREATGAQVVLMANQVGARDGVDDYLEMVDWNVTKLSEALDVDGS